MRSVQPAQRRNARRGLLRLASRALAPGRATARPAAEPRRVLLLRPDHIGDVLLTSPAVALLRNSLPNAHVTYLVGPWSGEAARHGPPIDRLWTLPFPGFTRHAQANLLAPYLLLASHARRLRSERFDLAVMFRPDHWWGALLALAAGIPVRVGGLVPETAPLLTHARAAQHDEHAAEQSLALGRLALHAFGTAVHEPPARVVFHVSQAARTTAERVWRDNALDDRRVVALHPSAGAALKSWPVDNWARLADGLHVLGLNVVLVGAPADRPLLAAIQARMAQPPAATACGQSLDESAAIYARSALLVGLDSGAAHLAAAGGTPTVRLYGPASTEVFGPWPSRADQQVMVTHQLACVPCGHLEAPPCGARTLPACLLALGVEQVLNAARQQLNLA